MYDILFLRHVVSNKTYDFCMFSKFVKHRAFFINIFYFRKFNMGKSDTFVVIQGTDEGGWD